MPTRKSCFCEGSNSNCRYCSGTGIREAVAVGERIQSGRPGRPLLPAYSDVGWLPPSDPQSTWSYVERSRRRAPSLVACPVCHQRIKEAKLKSHLERQHGPGQGSSPNVKIAASKPLPSLSHLRTVTTPSPGIPRGFAPCPECNYPIRLTKLASHLRLAHGIFGARLAAPPPSREVRLRESSGANLRDSVAPEAERQEERRLDATRDYSQLRESGRFGSHSSHDDFGDDSAP